MDEDIKELTRLLASRIKPDAPESKMTVGWAVVIGVLATILGFLMVGYINNANNITRLQAELKMQTDLFHSMQQSQARIEAMILDIRVLQAAKQKEAKGND